MLGALYDSLLDHYFVFVITLSLVFFALVFGISLASERPRDARDWRGLAVLCAIASAVFGAVMSLALHELTGAAAVQLAKAMPANHPGLAEYRKARADHSMTDLFDFQLRYRHPVGAGDLLVLDLAVKSMASSASGEMLESAMAELASGYVSKQRFDEIARQLIKQGNANPPMAALAARL